MLHLWRKELRVVLCPSKVIVAAFSGGRQREVVSHAILPVSPATPGDWRSAITALEYWLTENEIGKADVKIQLSNCFVRFAIMPFTDSVNDYAERLIVAGLLFESIYGESAKQWKLTLDEAQYGEPCLVAAIDLGLAEAIDQMASSRGFRVAAVQPYAASALNAFGKQIQDGEGLFVVVEHGQAVLIDIKEKKISGIRKVVLGVEPGGQEIVNTLQREMLIGGLTGEAARIYLHIAGDLDASIPAVAGMNVIALQHVSRIDHLGAGHEMACVEDEQ